MSESAVRPNKDGATDYKTMGGEKSAPISTERDWEFRGSVLGIFLDVLATFGSHGAVLVFMFWNVGNNLTHVMHCQVGDDKFNLSVFEAVACEYTKTFTRCFPPIAVSFCLLLVWRNILYERFYYNLLKYGGVLDLGRGGIFGNNSALWDQSFLILFICYLHVLLHIVFLCSQLDSGAAIDAAKEGIQNSLSHNEEAHGRSAAHASLRTELAGSIIDMVSFVALPGAIFITFFFQAYDLEKTLVPLSEYIEGETGKLDLNKLVVVSASRLKDMLVETDAKVCRQEYAHRQDLYTAIIKFYEEYKPNYQFEPQVHLLDSLWPARVLFPSNIFHSENDRVRFLMFWAHNVTVSAIFQIFVFSFFCFRLVHDGNDVLQSQTSDICAVLVDFLHLCLAIRICVPLVEAQLQMWATCRADVPAESISTTEPSICKPDV